MLRKSKSGLSEWTNHCDPHLLTHLIANNNKSTRYFLPYLLLSFWIITTLALAGPTWSLYAQNVYQKNIARVIALDVSQAMNTHDIAPSRLERAKYKILDILHNIKEGQTGMIVFSSTPFVVSPLTSDTNTIASQIPVIDSSIVPVQGSNLKAALQKSASLLNQAGYSRGEIILITASRPTDEDLEEAAKLAKNGYITSILGIGTSQGGVLTDEKGSLITDKNGNAIVASLDSNSLKNLAQSANGIYTEFSNDSSDIQQLLNHTNLNNLKNNPNQTTETKNLWKDEGHWLIWLLIILCAFIARKGWLEKIC